MMGKALHTKSIWKSNLMTDIRLASEAGFGAMEVAAETSRLLDKYVLGKQNERSGFLYE